MMFLLQKVAEVLGSTEAVASGRAKGYSIDSRRIEPGQLFFAIRGPHFNGHDFVWAALENGASGAVVERAFRDRAPEARRSSLIPVDDPSRALQTLGRYVRRQWGGCVIGVTGSMGKTTTKEMIAALLQTRFSVLKSPGNLNNEYGLPLTLLGLEPSHEIAVVELAMSAPGEIARLARIAEPEVGVVTNVAPVHLEFFDSVESIARAKRELIENLTASGRDATAILNFDDARVRSFAENFQGRVLTFGLGDGAMFRAREIQSLMAGQSRFWVSGPNLEAKFILPLPGVHNVENALAALAAASVFEVPASMLQQTLGSFKNLSQRSEILTLPRNITVINDCYNSNPLALERMLEALAGWSGAKRRIVVVGEMLELGPTSPEWHRKAGRKLVECGVDRLVAVQGDARFVVEGALESGLDHDRAAFFPDASAAAKYCESLLQEGDVVLIKGSRGVNLERVTELLGGPINSSRVCSEAPGRTV